MHVFGLTGGIASGKSAVAARFVSRGVPVIDADLLAREAVAVGSDGLAQVVARFGAHVLATDGSLDRKKLAAEAFGDDEKRRALNGILHPIIGALGIARGEQHRAAGALLVCYEAALIIENRAYEGFRPLVVVAAPEETQIARATVRDAASADDIRARIRAQMPLAEKVKVADFVIENTGTLTHLERRTDEVLTAICTRVGIDPDLLAPTTGVAPPAPGR